MGNRLSIYNHSRWKIGAVIAVAGLIYLIGNNSVALWDRDEPRYAMASRWMATHDDWVVPRIGWGENPTTPRTAKPILIYWLQAACMKVLEATSGAARLPSALAMVLTLIVVAVAVNRFAGARHAFWTTLILASCVMMVVAAKMCVTDSVLLLWVTIGQVCLFAIYKERGSFGLSPSPGTPGEGWGEGIGSNARDIRSTNPALTLPSPGVSGEGIGVQAPAPTNITRWATVFWIAIGLGGLTKGPVALGIPATTMIVLALFERRISWWQNIRPILGLLIVGAIVGPWLIVVHYRAPGVLHQMIFHDVVERVQTGLEGHKEPPGFYLVTIFGTFFPWSLMLPLAIGTAWKNRHRPEIRFALAAIIGPWVMMELVQTKLVHYLLPVFPPLAFLVADAAIGCFDGKYKDLTNTAAFVGGIVWGLIVIALCSLPWVAVRRYSDLPWCAMLAMSVMGIIAAGVVAILLHRKRAAAALMVMAIGFMAVMAVLFGFYFPEAKFLRLSPRIAQAVNAGATARDDCAMIGYREQSVAFYCKTTVREEGDKFLATQPEASWPSYIVITRNVFDALPKEKQSRLQILSEFEGMNYAKSPAKIQVLVAKSLRP